MNDVLLAVLLQAQLDGDEATVAKIKALADRPDELAALVKQLQPAGG